MDEIKNLNLSSSVELSPETTSSLAYNITGDERLYTVLYRKIESMEKKITDLETKKIIDETKLPIEILEENNLLPAQSRKLKCGHGFRPLLRSEIEEAKKHSKFCSQQAKWLGVHFLTLKKYSKMYNMWEPKHKEAGKKQPHDPNTGKYPLYRILNGEFEGIPAVDEWKVKNKLLKSDIFPLECSICGYNKRHIVTGKPYLLLDHQDGNRKNFKKENLRFLCYNCTVECGRGYIRRGLHAFDPEWYKK